MAYRCALLDDFQNVTRELGDWSKLGKEVEITVFNKPIGDNAKVIETLKDYDIVVLMRERTPFLRPVIEGLPKLKLLITTGAKNNSVDVAACKERGITFCGTPSYGNPTTGIVFGLMLELTRRIGFEHARLKAGEYWQLTIGQDLEGLTLGVIGLGKLGIRVANVANAFGMKVIAWSPNMTPEKAKEHGCTYVSKEDLFRQADITTIQVQLGERSRGLVGAKEIGLMKPTALFINTARAAIVDEAALMKALQEKKIAGAGLDVFMQEPLPVDSPWRKMDNVVITPHLGYVSQQNYAQYYPGIIEDIRGWIDGKPVRVIS